MNLYSIPLGPLHIPVFGLFAAVGLVAAMLLLERTAPIVGIPTQHLWNTGVFAILTAFILSRLLLFAQQPRQFLAAPLTLLAQPSLTCAGVWITCLLLYAWLRLQRMPVFNVLDAAAPSAAAAWLMLSLGHFVEGTAAGMPTRLPWAVLTAGDTMLGRVHPTQIYTVIAALLLLAVTFCLLPRRQRAGDITALALIAGGLADFLIGMLRQPWETYGVSWLDPAQSVDLLLILSGCAVLALLRTPLEMRTQPEPYPAEALHAE